MFGIHRVNGHPILTGADLKHRVVDWDRTNIQQSALTAIYYTTKRNGTQIQAATAIAKSSAIFNSLQTGDEWFKDDTGYNFRYIVPGTLFTEAGEYAVKVHFDHADGPEKDFWELWQINVVDI